MSVGVRVTCVCVFVRVLSYVYDEELDNLTRWYDIGVRL
jgi:hypothetical protein